MKTSELHATNKAINSTIAGEIPDGEAGEAPHEIVLEKLIHRKAQKRTCAEVYASLQLAIFRNTTDRLMNLSYSI